MFQTSLPVYSVPTKEDAEMLIRTVSSLQYQEHPDNPGNPWYKIDINYKRYLELDDIPKVTEKLNTAWQRIKPRKSST